MNSSNTVALKSGIKLAYLQTPGRTAAHFGIVIRAGTRDETTDQHGIAHFLEHMLFKGTQKRKPFHILNRMESIGGELNAYTTKEFTCVYTSFPELYLARAVDLLTDIVFRPDFPIKEIEKERSVILDEIASYQDDYPESIYDEFEQRIFSGHSLGHLILGTESSVRSFKRNTLIDFYEKNYLKENIVLSYAGPSSLNRIIRSANKALSTVKFTESKKQFKPFANYLPFNKTVNQNSFQAYCVMGKATYGINDDKRYTLSLLNNLLCGDNMNSRLNLLVREKRGWAYSISSEYIPYSEVGAFSIQFSCEERRVNDVVKIINRELASLSKKELSKTILSRAKKQLLNRLEMAMDNSVSVMLANAKSLLDQGEIKSRDEIIEKINSITPSDLRAIAEENFSPSNMSTLIYLPKNA